MDIINKRLEILMDGNQITKASLDLGVEVFHLLTKNYNELINGENTAMLITHIVIANERMLINQPIDAVDDLIYQQMVKNQYYQEACMVCDQIIKLIGPHFIKAEQNYILMHLVGLIGKINEE